MRERSLVPSQQERFAIFWTNNRNTEDFVVEKDENPPSRPLDQSSRIGILRWQTQLYLPLTIQGLKKRVSQLLL